MKAPISWVPYSSYYSPRICPPGILADCSYRDIWLGIPCEVCIDTLVFVASISWSNHVDRGSSPSNGLLLRIVCIVGAVGDPSLQVQTRAQYYWTP